MLVSVICELELAHCCSVSPFARIRRATPCATAFMFVACAVGCTTTEHMFPTAGELAAIVAQPTPPPPSIPRTHRVRYWKLAEPAPMTLGSTQHETSTPAGALLAAMFGRNPSVVRSGGLACVAREYGRFWLIFRAMPAPELETFVQARCGEPVGHLEVRIKGGAGPGGAALSGPWRDHAAQLLKSISTTAPTAVGVWSGEANGQSVVAVVYGRRWVHLEPVRLDAGAGGQLEVRGRYLAGSGTGTVYVTRGAYGYERCAAVPGTTTPRFHFRCAMDPTDPSVMVEMIYAPPKSLLGWRAMIGLVAPGRVPTLDFAAVNLTVASAPMLRRDSAAMLAAINELRRRAGSAPLREAKTQSAIAARVLPHMLSASHDGDEGVFQTVALGMMAGWEVHDMGLISGGDFGAMTLFGVATMDAAVESLLMSPVYRSLLLDPKAEVIALATKDLADGKVTSALVTTYTFYRDTDYAEEHRKLLDRLDAERAALGKSPSKRVHGGAWEKQLARTRTEIKEGKGLQSALDDLLQRIAATEGITVAGRFMEGLELDQIVFPPELLKPDRLQIAVAVDHYQPKGSPWGRRFVMMVYSP